MAKKFKGSFANVSVGKAATFGFKTKKFKTLEDFADQCVRQAWIPCEVSQGYRTSSNITKIFGWLRFDCDMKGEMETITSILDSNGLQYMCLPSTNYHPKTKSHKWHISVVAENQDSDYARYKWQCKQALVDLGITLHDRRVTEVCVQNMNPYRNGQEPVEGVSYVKIKDGKPFKFKNAPKDISHSDLTKTIFNGKGSNEVIPKKVVYATETFESLSPDSGIKIDKIGWVQLKDLNLDIGSMIGGLSCPSHNTRHSDGNGAHKTGYAFATMDEGGDVWIKCTGAECKGKTYKMQQDDFGANTKLSDLYELRRVVSLSAFNFDKNCIYYMKDSGHSVLFRWKDVFDFWSKELFWKIDMSFTEENITKKNKLLSQKEKAAGNIGLIVDIDKKIEALELDNEYEIIEKALANEKYFKIFKAKYAPRDGKMPHQLYIEDIVENVGKYIRTNKQHNEVVYEVDPFMTEMIGRMNGNSFVITLNKILPPYMNGKPNQMIIDDYLDHNPYLLDILNMIMAQRYGADKKSSYLWLKADSDWGKTFLFEGMMEGLGYPISEAEIKNAIKGNASGLDPDKIIQCSFVVCDEFKGAVSELKNIATYMAVTPKFKSKIVIPMYMKIFLSAEVVSSLVSSLGVEAQFANRFLYIELKGSLLKRDVYLEDMDKYKKNIKLYINQQLHKIKTMYDSLGKEGAVKKANEIYADLVTKYAMKNNDIFESTVDALPKAFRDWIAVVRSRENLLIDSMYKDCFIFEKDRVVILNAHKAKEVFIQEALEHEASLNAKHKTVNDLFGSEIKRGKYKLEGQYMNVYILELTENDEN